MYLLAGLCAAGTILLLWVWSQPTAQTAASVERDRPARRTGALTSAGILGVVFGLMICGIAAITGLNLILFGCGLFFVAAGFSSRIKRLCPACKMEVPRDASVCGHCRRDLPA